MNPIAEWAESVPTMSDAELIENQQTLKQERDGRSPWTTSRRLLDAALQVIVVEQRTRERDRNFPGDAA